jgi:membrane protein implicated in regulation of membrane protease activity
MNNKVYKIFEYAYLVMFFLSVFAVVSSWSSDKDRAYLFMFFGAVAIFMYFFKRNFRRRMEKRQNKND